MDDTHRADSGPGGRASGVLALHRQARYRRWLGWYPVAAAALFFASAFAGYAVVGAIPVEQLRPLVPDESVLPEFSTAAIAVNNLRVLAMVAAGLITLSVVPGFVLLVNGLVVGAVVALVLEGTSWVVILAALVPHGVFELGAFWIGAGITLRFSHRLVRWALGWDDRPVTRVEAFELAVWFAALALVIVVAAWIEVTVTPEVIRLVGGSDALGIS